MCKLEISKGEYKKNGEGCLLKYKFLDLLGKTLNLNSGKDPKNIHENTVPTNDFLKIFFHQWFFYALIYFIYIAVYIENQKIFKKCHKYIPFIMMIYAYKPKP